MPAPASIFRQTFQGRACVLGELRMVGRARITRAQTPGLTGHSHPGVFEIFLIERGEAQWWVEGESHRLVAGDVYLNRPGERHGSIGPSLRPCSYCWVQLASPRGWLPGLDARAGRRIVRALANRRVRSFPATAAIRDQFTRLWEIHVRPDSNAVLRARAHLHLLLAELTDAMARHAGRRTLQTFAIRRILNRIEADPGQPHPIPELARQARLGLTQFNERFLAELGFTPADYIRRHRITRAKERLRAKEVSITALAADLGFSSSQHFATVFKKLEGVTPSEFRATVQAG